ncbi:MAG: beta-ketoacyl-[acyl-carrier-protein] synthase family protein [Blastochloris sp.]|nr:beta-ketoacyl-[acyl-carrier-protein] synthase family protein [Blastochloris sp.]
MASRADHERVVVTGRGVLTAYGSGVASLQAGLRSGLSAIRFQEHLHEDLPCRIGARVAPEWGGRRWEEGERGVGWIVRMAEHAARQAWTDAGLEFAETESLVAREGLRLHVSLGWGAHDEETLQMEGDAEAGLACLERVFRPSLGVRNYLSACAASTQALARAWADLSCGRVQRCLVGGADSRLHEMGILGYSKLGALAEGWEARATEACRPFDVGRKGFVIGEGAGFLVLESLETARHRGAKIHAELVAGAGNTDSYRLTDRLRVGRWRPVAILECLERGGCAAGEVDYIQAHGTGTLANDRAEAASLRRVFGERLADIPVSSLKPYFGHLAMAAGVVESVACVDLLGGEWLPPALNCQEPEPGLGLLLVGPESGGRRVGSILKNSFGFGGQNACVLWRKLEWG